jgi:hypothetical protein
MPVSRPTVDGLADELGGLYRALEQELAAGIGRRLSAGLDAEDWQVKKLAATSEVRRWIGNTVRRFAGKSGKLARGALSAAFERGAGEAQRELAGRRGMNIPGVQRDLPGAHAIDRLAGALAGRLDGAHLQIARSATDAYQRAVAAPAALALGGALTRRQAAERAWNGLLDQGFTGFVDKAGRRWTAAGYVEMATRTATAQAAVQGHLDRMAQLGIDLVIVSDAAQECRLCRPWEGKILSRTGPDGARTVEVESELDGSVIKVKIAGSLAEAIRAGLFHPNCRHSVSAYLPGLTKAPKDTADPKGDEARQQLRYLERETRRWKLREAGALSPADKARAAGKVQARQAQIKAHVQANDLTRRRDREQIDLGNRRAEGAEARGIVEQSTTLRDAVDAGIAAEHQLGGGAMARVDLVVSRDGTRMVRKLAKDSSGRPAVDQQDAEELGALVMRALRAKAPEVLRETRNEVYMNYVQGEPLDPAETLEGQITGTALEDARSMAFADILMGNTDRNEGNALKTALGHIWGVDHGAAFDFHPEFNPPGAAPIYRNLFRWIFIEGGGHDVRFRKGALRPGEAGEARAALQSLEPEFRRLKRLGWYRDMLRRLKAMEEA